MTGCNCVYITDSTGYVKKILGRRGRPSSAPGEFNCPAGAAFLPGKRIVVADAKNHRVQLFNSETGEFYGVVMATLKNDMSMVNVLSSVDVAEVDGRVYIVFFHLTTEPGFTMFKVIDS